MIHQLQHSFTANAARAAFYMHDTFYTYSQLAQRAYAIAAWLQQQNPQRKPVGIIAADEFDTYAGLCGILMSGAPYVPILPDYPKDRSQSIIEQAGIEIVLSPIPAEGLVNTLPQTTRVVETGSIPVFAGDFVLPEISDTDRAYILFTSGSTGKPKGVPLTHGNLSSFMDSFFALGYDITHSDRFLQMFDLTFDLSVMSYLAPLLKGACVYPVPAEGMKYMSIYTLLEDQEITFSLMVPSMLSYLRPYFEDINLPQLRHSLFCGEALYADIAAEWQQCVPNVLIQNVYGPTEATIFCLTYDCVGTIKQYNGMVCIGKPMKNVGTLVVNDENKPVGEGDKGELCLSGGQVTPGYINNPEKNAEAFFIHNNERYYRTGDIVYADADGDYMYCGRADYQVKVKGGFRVELNEVEAHARNYTQLSGVAAVAPVNTMGIAQIYLYLEGFSGDATEVHGYLKTQMPDYMLPEQIISIEVFPLNNNGKVDRKALTNMLSQAANS
ncbi:MAG: D-alanine--poly(phosphoribitol) ligase [Bacteroidetes bacterium]|nr:MAG: D-alanine--poly(phosphoribitol) ligase [Bacteroidota bacterium]